MPRLQALALAIFMLAGLAGTATAESLTPRAFTEAFAATASAAMPAAKVTVAGELHLETHSATGENITTDLHNAYQVYLADPEHLDAVIKRYVAVLVEAVGPGDAKLTLDRSHIVPVLKSTVWVQAVQRQRSSAPAVQLLTEPFNSELTIVYAEDRPSSIRFLMTRDDVGDHAKLRDLALGNLKHLLPKIEMRALPYGTFVISTGGNYEASLLLADSIWSDGQIKVDGDIVVAVPLEDALLITGSNNPAGIMRLRALAADLAAGPYGLTASLFVYRGGKWLKFAGK